MKIRIDSLLTGAAAATGTAVIIDVFRAFTTAAIVLARGAEAIIFVEKVDEALDLRRRGLGDLCLGEVGGVRPEGFDFGNSPFELSTAALKGLTCIQSTRAGTTGVAAAIHADRIFAASLVNSEATAKAVIHSQPELVTLVAMGVEGKMRADEDEICALYLRNLLEGRRPDPDAVRQLVLASAEAQKFGAPSRPHFHLMDRDIALQINSMDFAITVTREKGLLVARAERAGGAAARDL